MANNAILSTDIDFYFNNSASQKKNELYIQSSSNTVGLKINTKSPATPVGLFSKKNGNANASNYSFALIFQPGVLIDLSQITLGPRSHDWAFSAALDDNQNAVLYFLSKNHTKINNLSFSIRKLKVGSIPPEKGSMQLRYVKNNDNLFFRKTNIDILNQASGNE